MYPDNLSSITDLTPFEGLSGVVDIVYNPLRTGLLLQAEALGIPHANGLGMLVAQAVRAHEFFFDTKVDDKVIEDLTAELTRNATNLVLIGMPGSGKSTVGRLLAKMTGKKFIDADAFLVQKAGKTIPEIFASHGEAGFRALETQVLEELGCRSGLIIATGGGCVTRQRNYPLLHQNGTILWLQRDLDKLPTDGRPLSQANPLADMYTIREPLYRSFADHSIDNNADPSNTVRAILRCLTSF